jgi:DNA-binding protein YbaB
MSTNSDAFEQWVQQANAMQTQLTEARSRLVEAEVTGASGPVSLTLGATGDLRDIHIHLDTIDDVAKLQRQIMAAHAEANAALHQIAQEMMQPFQDLVSGVEGLAL